ncbi:response regulator receiver modulated FAD-dependent pyridine nucleotide-disulphide oxidoreductase [Kineococcus radiotolerans SRS30216 = ATCC BAA-149]|uniref:Response regulator receiver modulated FAD-dependent pyridine nucleotide-disulphide oxidoreductase n=1 Tax=Kineococcus radiotolerans (strain ATCC BAA-149 / DSM 14245 / SRS30216) TaxID=266940 RepID=A6WAE0_KINRD|nr:response regulator receiver modulated FAD-dependent pyridine nucleotide-disulphide oxidoreductase [Kineococcus radiotolerans SRS30216 = ATCC BAA-149]
MLMTVDDDPAVSRAVARDLRRRYGQAYRVLRADCGDDAIAALREVKLRGGTVAAVLADYRMPQMDGVQLLEQAMDLFPTARRVLLTAYADTSAAIRAINDVDLDHYLLKPWNPPEEKLYPVLDALLESWHAAPPRPADEVVVIGDRWSARSFAVRDFLARNEVPYRWLRVDEAEAGRLLEAAGLGWTDDLGRLEGPIRLPVVLTPPRPGTSAAEGGRPAVLVDPDDTTLAEHVGLSTRPARDFYDVAIVGGGPAGLGAAVYAASEGLRTVMIEERATGGQAGQSSRIENYLGFPDGLSGAQLADRARRQVAKFGAETLSARSVTRLEVSGSARVLHFTDGTSVAAHTVLLATGVAYRTLQGPGVEQYTGRGIYYGAALSEANACADEDVFVVGAANSAGQSAVNLARSARSVTMLVRGPSIDASMSSYLIEQIAQRPNIRVLTCTEVVQARGGEHLSSIVLRDRAGGDEREVAAQHVFVFIGAEPRTSWLDGVVERDAKGFIVAGPDLHREGDRPPGWVLDRAPYHLETSVPGVFVAGDARAESVKRVASAVGEGAMAVMLVHRYLAQS